jgi:multiple sugar transport system substrate-binding protein
MCIDPAVLQRAGVTFDDTTWTWADYERIALQIFQRTGVQSFPPVQFRQTLEHIGRQFGAELFTSDERSMGIEANRNAFNAFRDYLNMELRLLAAGALFDPEEGFIQGLAMGEEPLARGRTWNNGAWSNQYFGHQNASERPLHFAMFPTVSGNRAPFGTYLRASMYISMLSSSENKDLAARFINFFANNLEANRILMAERGVPIPSNVRADLYYRVDANNQYIFDYITKITPLASPAPPPYPPNAGEVETALRSIVLQNMTGRITTDAALAQMISTANSILRR